MEKLADVAGPAPVRFPVTSLPKSRFRIYGGVSNYLSVARDLLTGRVESGTSIDELETRAAAFLGTRHAVAMPQARVGIYLTLRALIQPGQSVVLSPYTIHDVINMVICAGGRPVFADISRETCGVDHRAIEAALDETAGAVMVTHLHGVDCGIEAIADLCRRRGVPLIEDTAQALGGAVGGRRLGSFGRAGIFSFGMAKNVNSFYGGLVATDDDALRDRLKAELADAPYQARELLLKRVVLCLVGDILTWRPIFDAFTFWIYRYGYLHGVEAITNRWRGEDEPVRRPSFPPSMLRRMTPMQARLILRALPSVDADMHARVRHARLYHEGLQDIDAIGRPRFRDDGSHVYLTYPIQVEDRDRLLRFLTVHGRDLTVQHIGNNAEYACFSEFSRDCPNSAAAGRQVILLPTYPAYGPTEVRRNIALIRRYFNRA